MTRLTDGKMILIIEMLEWESNTYKVDWSADFFEVGTLEYDEESEAYVVTDTEYCYEQAEEWSKENENNFVFVDWERVDAYV